MGLPSRDNSPEAEQFRKLQAKNQKLINGIKAVRSLINESQGIYGLHLNGDPCSWGEIEEGGHMEEWLIDFNIAEDEI